MLVRSQSLLSRLRRFRWWRSLAVLALAFLALAALPLAGNPLAGFEELPMPEPDEAVAEACRQLGNRLGSVSVEDCLSSGLVASSAHSVDGVPILVREYPPLENREPVGRVLLIGGIHGDEYSSVSIVFRWLSILNRFHSGLFHWRIVPVVNPDGLLRRPGQRMNANGVDLNRNFPCPDWIEETSRYWIEKTSRNPRRYPGPQALSEPETSWLAKEIERFDPGIIVSVHAPHNVLDFDGPKDPPQSLGPLHLKLLGTYPGSLGRYAGVHQNIPVVTIELPSAGSMPSWETQRAIWVDLVRWLKKRLQEESLAPSETLTTAER